MSVTFDVERERKEIPMPVCPKCKASLGGSRGVLGCDYQGEGEPYPCDGYGPTPAEFEAQMDESLNVANANASAILYDLLGYGRSEVDPYGGSLDSADVLRRLATAESKAQSLVRAPSQSRGVYIDANGVGQGALAIDCGRSAGQVTRYIDKLRALASKGPRITYG